MMYPFLYELKIGDITVISNVCLATIEAAETDDGWTIDTITIVKSDDIGRFRERPMAVLSEDHWLWDQIASHLLRNDRKAINARWKKRTGGMVTLHQIAANTQE